MTNFQPKKIHKKDNLAHSKKENEGAGYFPEERQASDLLNKDFKITMKYAQIVKGK